MQITAAQSAKLESTWRGLQNEEAAWSTRSRHTVVAEATHYIHLDQPPAVIDAVREVVSQVRAAATAQPARRLQPGA